MWRSIVARRLLCMNAANAAVVLQPVHDVLTVVDALRHHLQRTLLATPLHASTHTHTTLSYIHCYCSSAMCNTPTLQGTTEQTQ
jgi:hypothetical protein